MDTSAIDFAGLAAGMLVAGVITAAVAWAARGDSWSRLWISAGVMTVLLMAAGFADLLRERPRETHVATLLVGIPLPILGAIGIQRGMRRARPWLRWSGVFLTALTLLFLGMLIGAALLPRYLGA